MTKSGDEVKEKVSIRSITVGVELVQWIDQRAEELGLRSRQELIRHYMAQAKERETECRRTNIILSDISENINKIRGQNEDIIDKIKK